MHRVNDRLLQRFIHLPQHRSRLILDLDSSVVTVFGQQENAEVGYNPRYRGKRSYNPLLCLEANSSYLWDTELRPGNAGTWDGSVELMATCFANLRRDIRELHVRADAVFSFQPVNQQWEMSDFDHPPHGWSEARRFVVARRFLPAEKAQTSLFTLGRYMYRAWVANLNLTPAGIWHFYDGRAGMEPRICELREDYALRKIPTASYEANALYLEIIRLAYNLVTAFQLNCLPEHWQRLTLQKLRYKLPVTRRTHSPTKSPRTAPSRFTRPKKPSRRYPSKHQPSRSHPALTFKLFTPDPSSSLTGIH